MLVTSPPARTNLHRSLYGAPIRYAVLALALGGYALCVWAAEEVPQFKRGMWQTDEAMEIKGKVLQYTTKSCTIPLQSLFHVGRGLCPTVRITKSGADYLIKPHILCKPPSAGS
jgi:hypothetical protein